MIMMTSGHNHGILSALFIKCMGDSCRNVVFSLGPIYKDSIITAAIYMADSSRCPAYTLYIALVFKWASKHLETDLWKTTHTHTHTPVHAHVCQLIRA